MQPPFVQDKLESCHRLATLSEIGVSANVWPRETTDHSIHNRRSECLGILDTHSPCLLSLRCEHVTFAQEHIPERMQISEALPPEFGSMPGSSYQARANQPTSNADSKTTRTRFGERLPSLERFVCYHAIHLLFPEKCPETVVRVNFQT